MINHIKDFVPDHDPVNHPRHYTQYDDFEVIDITEQFNFNLGNALKYIMRAGSKGDFDEDVDKAIWYLNREKEYRRKQSSRTDLSNPSESS